MLSGLLSDSWFARWPSSTSPIDDDFDSAISVAGHADEQGLGREDLGVIAASAHLQGWIGEFAYMRLPHWFQGGVGRHSVGRRGRRIGQRRGSAGRGAESKIIIDEAGSLQNLGDLRVDRTPANKASWYPVVLAYRQAGMFVTYLRESDWPGGHSIVW
jgi:hypothetical protein